MNSRTADDHGPGAGQGPTRVSRRAVVGLVSFAGLGTLPAHAARRRPEGAAAMTSVMINYSPDSPSPPVSLEVLVRGTGPLVVLIASLGRGAADFDDLAERLAVAGYRTAAINPRGIGKSRGPEAKTLADYAQDVAQVIGQLSPPGNVPGKAVVVGHAFGNRVARATAAFQPQVVSSLILLASGGQVPIPPEPAKALKDVFDESLSPEAHIKAVQIGFFAPGNDPEVWRHGWFPAVAQAQQAALRASPADSWTGAGATTMLIVQAADDTIAPPENAQALLAAAPDRVSVQILNQAGHAMLPEQPVKLAQMVIARLQALAT